MEKSGNAIWFFSGWTSADCGLEIKTTGTNLESGPKIRLWDAPRI
jgi:hypothetical protein